MKAGSYELSKEELELLESGKESLRVDKREERGTLGDRYAKEMMIKIIEHGCWDQNPRPKYHDIYPDARDFDDVKRTLVTSTGETIKLEDNQTIHEYEDRKEIWTPAHTISVNHEIFKYNEFTNKGESPLLTLRNIACRDAISELFWIWVKGSNDLVEFDELLAPRSNTMKAAINLPGRRTWLSDSELAKYIELHPEVTRKQLVEIRKEAEFIQNWWNDWAIRDSNGAYVLNKAGHPHIGSCYGYTNSAYDQINELRNGIKKDPDGRRHILSLWQLNDFKSSHGLKPCAFLTIWNVRHGRDGIDYLDCVLVQRSSDFMTAGSINQYQYMVLQSILSADLGYEVGQFTWYNNNVQIYDRHIPQALEQINRTPINCSPETIVHNEGKDFADLEPRDVELVGYPRKLINEKNPQQKFQLGI